jgi:hypothetical protein
MKKTLVLLVGLAVLVLPLAHAAVGVSATTNKEYDSPLVLTVAFPATDTAKWGKGAWETSEDLKSLSEYICDRVYLKEFQLSVVPTKKGQEVEEKKDTTWKASVDVPAPGIKSDPSTNLRITMEVEDD